MAESSPPLTLRTLLPDDLDRLFNSATRQFGVRWLEQQARDEVYIAVAELDGQAVGRVGLDFTRPETDGAVHLWAAHVETAFQSRGVGSALIAHLEYIARARGYRSVHLDVGKDNPLAYALYLRLGYTVFAAGAERWTYRDATGHEVEVIEECWRMRKPLV